MSKPKISIVVPIYKAENTIRRLLDSFESQPYQDIEYFLIDNASPDKCGEICQEYVDRDSRFVLHTLKENIGYIRARMYGINNCNGEFVGFSDSDDYIPENCYEEILDCIKKEDPDFVTCGFCGVFGDEFKHNHTVIPQGIYKEDTIENDVMPALFGNNSNQNFLEGFMWKNFYKQSIIIDNNIDFQYELVPYEDQIFNIDFVKCCKKVAVIDKEVYFYVSNLNSITGSNVKNFKFMDEYDCVSRLFTAKMIRNTSNKDVFIANDFVVNLYPMFLSMAKFCSKKDVKKLQSIFDDSYCEYIKKYSNFTTKKYKLTKIFVERKQFMLLVIIMNLALKLRG